MTTRSGAATVVVTAGEASGLAYVEMVPDTAVALAWLSAAQYNFPSRQLTLIGVTGTDGKTSTANILYGILQTAGIKS